MSRRPEHLAPPELVRINIYIDCDSDIFICLLFYCSSTMS